jgi:hypothetical protein
MPPKPRVMPLQLAQMLEMAKGPRKRFTSAQVLPFCERLVAVLNKSLPATFTLVKESDSALTIRVEIHRLALTTGTPDVEA